MFRRSSIRRGLALAAVTLATSCAPQAPTPGAPAEPDEDWVRGYYELFHAELFDLEALAAYYAPDAHFVDPTFDIDVQGVEAIRALYAGIGTADSAYAGMRWELDRVLIDGPHVAIHGTWSGAFRDRPFEVQFVTLWTVIEGAIVEQKDFFDAPTFDEQVGWTGED